MILLCTVNHNRIPGNIHLFSVSYSSRIKSASNVHVAGKIDKKISKAFYFACPAKNFETFKCPIHSDHTCDFSKAPFKRLELQFMIPAFQRSRIPMARITFHGTCLPKIQNSKTSSGLMDIECTKKHN